MASRRKQSKPKSFADVDPLTGEPILNAAVVVTDSNIDSIATVKEIIATSNNEKTNIDEAAAKKVPQEALISSLKRKRQDDEDGNDLTTSMVASSSSSSSSTIGNTLNEEKNPKGNLNDDDLNNQLIQLRPNKVPATIVEENGEQDDIIGNENDDANTNEEEEDGGGSSNEPLSNQINPEYAHLNNEDDELIDEENYEMIDMDPSSLSSYNHHYIKDGVYADGYGSPINGDSLALDDDEEDDDDLNDTGDMKQYEGEGGQIMSSLLLQFKCKVCGKGFKHRRSLNRHVKLHSGEKNFICPYCTTAFARSDHLKAHIRTHNNSKPYSEEMSISAMFANETSMLDTTTHIPMKATSTTHIAPAPEARKRIKVELTLEQKWEIIEFRRMHPEITQQKMILKFNHDFNTIIPSSTMSDILKPDYIRKLKEKLDTTVLERCPICQCGYSTQAALKVHMAHHHSKSKFKCVLCNNLEFHSQLALEGHIYTKHSKENNDLNDLINETRGRYSQPIKLDYNKNNNDASYMNGSHGNSDHHHHHNNNHSNEQNTNNNNNNENYSSDDANTFNNYNRSRLTDINNIKELNQNNDTTNTNYGKESSNSNNNNTNNNHENNSPSNKSKLNEQSNRQKSADDDDDIIIEETVTSTSPSSSKPAITQPPLQKTNITPVSNSNGGNAAFNKNPIGGGGGGMLLNQQLKRIAPKIDSPSGIPSSHNAHYNSNHINRLLPPSQLPNKTSTAFIGTIRNIYPNGNNNNNGFSSAGASGRTLNGTHPHLHSHLNGNGPSSGGVATSSSTSNPPSTAPNTYCELCNARFSNVESYVAHMRNCHPSIPYNLNPTSANHQNTKMPYLTSILSSKSNQMIKSSSNGLNTSAISNGVIIPLNGQSKPSSSNGPTICNVPNCNCANSINTANNQAALAAAGVHPPYPPPPSHQPPSHLHHYSSPHENEMYVLKETHYTCVQCSLTFVKLNDYMTHLKHEHCVEVFRCILCKQMQLFDNLNLLKEHFFQVHQSHKYDLFKCKICLTNNTTNSNSSVFNNIEDLYAHLSNVHHHNMRTNGGAIGGGPGHMYSGAGSGNTSSPYNNHHYPHSSSHAPPPPSSMLPPTNSSSSIVPSNDRFHYLNHPNVGNSGNKCFKCNYCDSDFAQQNSLNQHIQMVHKINPTSDHHHRVSSGQPQPPIPSPHHSLQPHHLQSQQHHNNNHLSCQYCRNTFTNRSQLERHLRIHLSSIDLKCNICDRLFETQDSLSQHKLTHCKTYDMDSNNNNSISSTNIKSTGNSSINSTSNNTPTNAMAICVYCKHTIENEIQFKEHFKRHNNIGIQNQGQNGPNGATKTNSFICIVCRQTLTSNSEYNLHMKHHLRRLTQNNQINKTNINNSNGVSSIEKTKSIDDTTNSANNTTTTTANNKLKCSKCLVKFEVWQELVEHMSKAHNIRTASSSSLSSSPSHSIKSTTSNSSLPSNDLEKDPRNHDFIKQEPNTNTTSIVSKQTTIVTRASSSASSNSSFQGDHLCEICTCKFDTPSKLQSHLLLKHEFPIAANSSSGPLITALVCPVCDESFSRADHLLAHTAVHGQAAKIYKCTHCPLAFVFKSQLINHSFAHQNSQNQQQPTTPNSQNKAYNLRSHISPRTVGSSPQFNSPNNNSNNNNRTNNQNISITKIAPQLTNIQSINQTNKTTHIQQQHDDLNENDQNETNGDFDYNNVEENEEMFVEGNENKNNEVEGSNLDEHNGLNEENFVDETNENENFQTDQNDLVPIDEDLPQENEINGNHSEELINNNEEDMQENLEEVMTKSDTAEPISNKNNAELSEEAANVHENFNENEEDEFVVHNNDEDVDNLEC